MPQVTCTMRGWQAVLPLLALIAIVGVRLLTFRDQTDDVKLMRDLESQIVSDYLPNEVARLQVAMQAGDRQQLSGVAQSVTGAKPRIESVQISYPILAFSSSKDVVVKVVYALVEGDRSRDRKTLYFLYTHGVIGNTWRYRYETTALSYYLNFK
jgi:hypothetical protein